jgi:hypothetical protein
MYENNTLDKIDNALLAKSNNGRIAYYALGFIIAFALIYFALYDTSESFLDTNTRQLNDISIKLANEKTYIATHRSVIPALKQKIQTNTIALSDTRDTNAYLDNKLKELSYLLFNDKSWADFMDRLTALAKNYNVNILKIENNFLDTKNQTSEEVKQVLNIDVDSTGSFHSTMKFLNAIEKSQLVVDVYNSTISSSNRSNSVESNIQIAVWGMLY